MDFEKIETKCEELKCDNFVKWDFGYGNCISCKLLGQSYHIDEIPDDCPYKEKFKDEDESHGSKLEESNKKKRRNALAEKIFLSKINNGTSTAMYEYYDLIERCFKLADAFIEYSNK